MRRNMPCHAGPRALRRRSLRSRWSTARPPGPPASEAAPPIPALAAERGPAEARSALAGLGTQLDGRWQVIKRVWRSELREALQHTKGNIELAVAIAATMIISD